MLCRLNISASDKDNQGLFETTNGATIKNIHLAKVNIEGKNNSGGLIGSATGGTTVSKSSVTGNIAGTGATGGLIGTYDNIVFNGTISVTAPTVTEAYWDTVTTGIATGTHGSGKTTTELAVQMRKLLLKLILIISTFIIIVLIGVMKT